LGFGFWGYGVLGFRDFGVLDFGFWILYFGFGLKNSDL